MIDINELAVDLGLTRQNLNYHILEGRAGEVKKDGDGKTHEMIITVENVLILIKWLKAYGRGNKLKLVKAKLKYENIGTN